MINAYDVLAEATLIGYRDQVKSVFAPEEWEAFSAERCAGMNKIASVAPEGTSKLDFVRLIVNRAVGKKKSEEEISTILAVAADWLEL